MKFHVTKISFNCLSKYNHVQHLVLLWGLLFDSEVANTSHIIKFAFPVKK